MSNTLQFTASAEHVEAHQRLGRERDVAALVVDHYQEIVDRVGQIAARDVLRRNRKALRLATDHHRTFHQEGP
jgi:hypothetical protein